MKRHALQVVLLAFFVVNVAPSAASEGNGTETGADFTVNISREGVKEDSQQVFSLGPSASLRVVDESNKAIFLPQPTTAEQDTPAQYSLAYVFEKGKCNFEKTLALSDAFPGYSKALWVRTESEAVTDGKPAAAVANYTFMNPPSEYLSKGVSFCVRFTTSSLGTTTTTASPTSVPSDKTEPTGTTGGSSSQGGGSGNPQAGSGGGGEESTPGTNNQESPQTSTSPHRNPPPKQPQDGLDSSQEVTTGKPEAAGEANTTNPVVASPGETPLPGGPAESEQTSPVIPPIHSSSSNSIESDDNEGPAKTDTDSPAPTNDLAPSVLEEPKTDNSSGLTASESTHAVSGGNQHSTAEEHTRLRRLSATDSSAAKYLTVVVHSAASGLSLTTLSVAAVLLSTAATLLSSM
ncbi:putative toxoplasma gondii family A protein [Toxoplasma gondii GT1]|uniref:Putative toxoplasma gondii family A protein n=1 Tax=Toxoplasma gondii (strain ATCC 50853 / GT1) TaxID=507601 RepID=S7USN6_TOXGG|nr:putative toxoplasma gondii family A protein [Toxoplasma gondii GT1]